MRIMKPLGMLDPPQIVLFDGPTGVGKSLLLGYLREAYSRSIFVGKKFTTRPRRIDDSDWEFHFTPKVPEENQGYSFTSVGEYYAVNIREVRTAIAQGYTYAISCTDRGIKEALKNEFSTIVLFVYRALTLDMLNLLLRSRGELGDRESAWRREEFSSVAAQYLAQLDLYDHVVLNVGSESNAFAQMERILSIYGIRNDQENIPSARATG
jgi:guanylate kinase